VRKLDIVNGVRQHVGGLSKKEAGMLIDTLLDTMRDALAAGESVKVSGFGTFVLRSKRQRKGRNPHTGSALTIAQRVVLTFKPSHVLRDLINR